MLEFPMRRLYQFPRRRKKVDFTQLYGVFTEQK